MPTRKDLIKEANALGIDPKGTSQQLLEKIALKKKENLQKAETKPMVAKPKKEKVKEVEPTQAKNSAPEEVAIAEKKPEKSKPKKAETRAIPKAVPSASVLEQETAIALKTCKKYVAGWRKLTEGKPITASRDIIATLRQSGLVK